MNSSWIGLQYDVDDNQLTWADGVVMEPPDWSMLPPQPGVSYDDLCVYYDYLTNHSVTWATKRCDLAVPGYICQHYMGERLSVQLEFYITNLSLGDVYLTDPRMRM